MSFHKSAMNGGSSAVGVFGATTVCVLTHLGVCSLGAHASSGRGIQEVPYVSAMTRTELACGKASAAVVLMLAGVDPHTIERCIDAMRIDAQGVSSLSDLLRVLDCGGIEARAVRLTPEQLVVLREPCIVHLRGSSPTSGPVDIGHFIVVVPRPLGTTCRVYDSSSGVIGSAIVSYGDVFKDWSGSAIVVGRHVRTPAAVPLVLAAQLVCFGAAFFVGRSMKRRGGVDLTA